MKTCTLVLAAAFFLPAYPDLIYNRDVVSIWL